MNESGSSHTLTRHQHGFGCADFILCYCYRATESSDTVPVFWLLLGGYNLDYNDSQRFLVLYGFHHALWWKLGYELQTTHVTYVAFYIMTIPQEEKPE
jgi:hypothetical protein